MTAKLRDYLFGITVFMLVIGAGVGMMAIMDSNGQKFSSDPQFLEFNTSFNKINEMNESVTNMRDLIENADAEIGVFGVLNALVQTVWNALRTMFTSLSFMGTALIGMTSIFGVPAWVVGIILMMITILIVVVIISAVLQHDV